MLPTESQQTSAKIEWNKVTWYSKLLAVVLFVGLVCGAFFFGIWYQKQIAPVASDISTSDGVQKQSQQSTSTTTSNDGIVEIPCDPKNTAIPADAKPVVSNSEYLKDTQHVYLRRQDEAGLIPDADPATFRVLPDIDEFGMDAQHVYYAGCELPNANPETFTHLPNGTYGTDGTHIYWRWKLLSDIDAIKFVSLPRGYGKDDKIVYWEDEKVQGADPATFQSFEDKVSCNGSCTITAQDKNHTYMLNEIVQ
jgi:hypothetical protein